MWETEKREQKMLSDLTDLVGERNTAKRVLEYLRQLEEQAAQKRKQVQQEGIERARKQGIPLGRPKKKLPENSGYIFRNFVEGIYTAGQAAHYCNIGVSTLYRRVKEWEKGEENREKYLEVM